VENVVVTAVAAAGYFLQVPESSSDYAGAPHSGLFVFAGSSMLPQVGDLVTVDGQVSDFFGQTQLSDPTLTVTGTAALALKLLGRAETSDDADAMAQQMWAGRTPLD
ncbi:MAG: hypothetical protein CMM09_02540, partial [Rhodospirillaceae bacterium]|nr:hypothetical protein [Rhodospirillaceae bacterium]